MARVITAAYDVAANLENTAYGYPRSRATCGRPRPSTVTAVRDLALELGSGALRPGRRLGDLTGPVGGLAPERMEEPGGPARSPTRRARSARAASGSRRPGTSWRSGAPQGGVGARSSGRTRAGGGSGHGDLGAAARRGRATRCRPSCPRSSTTRP